MTRETVLKFDGLKTEYRDAILGLIDYFVNKQNNEDLTLKVIRNADKGIDLSESFDNVDDFMAALNA